MRTRLAERYSRAIEAVPHLEPPYDPGYAHRTWQSYAVWLSPEAPVARNELMRLLLVDGVASRRGVMAIHLEDSYSGETVDLPNTEAAAAQTLMLPLYPGLTDEQQDYVIDRLTEHLSVRAAAVTGVA